MDQSKHIWSFSTVGGVKRVNLENGSDLIYLNQLDQKLWTALSCPVEGLEIDQKTLELIDTDNNGQIRVPEIIEAVNWILARINNPNNILKYNQKFPLTAINENSPFYKDLKSSCNIILKSLGKEHQDYLNVEDTSDFNKIFAGAGFNGDGIITAESTKDENLKKIIEEIILCCGFVIDKGGQPGINSHLISKFKTDCNNYAEWILESNKNKKSILPFGEETEQVIVYYLSIKDKIDDYFLRCKLSLFDGETTDTLNSLTNRLVNLTEKNLIYCLEDISSFNLSKALPNKTLSLVEGLNPAWENAILLFKNNVFNRIFLDKNSLSYSDWLEVKKIIEPYEQWKNNKKGEDVEKLGIMRIQEIFQNNDIEKLELMIDEDLKMEPAANGIYEIDKLVRYYRDIYKLLNNFVTFYDFYAPNYKAIFQAGTLYIDQRSCDLCIKVRDMAKHATMVSFSGIYLIYCVCTSTSSNEKITIVAALTNGDTDNLVVGRNALFYDCKGQHWDATVIKIVENPISIRQAFWSPYRKVARMIENQINKFAAAQDSKAMDMANKKVEETPTNIENKDKAKNPAQAFDIGKYVGIFAAIGLAVGAIGTMIASFVTGFFGLVWWKMPIALIGLMLVISGPSMILAYLKLRKRNLAPLLDANGWAINARAIINIQFGKTLTHLATLPPNAKLNLHDPFSKNRKPLIPLVITMILLLFIGTYLLWKYGYISLPFMSNLINFFSQPQ